MNTTHSTLIFRIIFFLIFTSFFLGSLYLFVAQFIELNLISDLEVENTIACKIALGFVFILSSCLLSKNISLLLLGEKRQTSTEIKKTKAG